MSGNMIYDDKRAGGGNAEARAAGEPVGEPARTAGEQAGTERSERTGKPDIMVVMSDQHGYLDTGFADGRVDTPQLQRIAGEGMLFERCYCNAPLCVPSRMSFLTGQLPSDLGIFNNDSCLPGDMPTIAHEMGRLGYETVLVGRMHFKGDDQNHGFDRRVYGDITSQYWGTGGKARKDFGIYAGTTNRLHCTDAAGGGISPVMVYDEEVKNQALEFLNQWEQEKPGKPLFLVVGFYGPHFPFVCGEELYRKYQSRFRTEDCERDRTIPGLPIYEEYTKECDAGLLRDCRAAYCGLAEQMDGYVGLLYDRFRGCRRGKEHRFFYLSDHGEQLGRRRIFGKQTLYEHAVRVPFVAAGTGIPAGVSREPVGLLDVSRTLLSEAGETEENLVWHRGRTIDLRKPDLAGHWVVIQQMLERDGERFLAQAAVRGRYKVMRARETWYVYHLETDREETRNLAELCPGKAEPLIREAVEAGCFLESREMKELILQEQKLCDRQKRLKAWGKAAGPREWATVAIPPGVLRKPIR